MDNSNQIQEIKIDIAPVLKNMDINHVESFPIIKYSSVGATIYRIQTESKFRYKRKKNNDKSIVEVTRTA